MSLEFDNCTIDQMFLRGNFKWLKFINCHIKTIVNVSGYVREVTFKDCAFSDVFSVNIQFENCAIDHSGEPFNYLTMRTLNFLHNENLSACFQHCKSNPSKKGHLVNMGNCDYKTLWVENCEFFEAEPNTKNVKVDRVFYFQKTIGLIITHRFLRF